MDDGVDRRGAGGEGGAATLSEVFSTGGVTGAGAGLAAGGEAGTATLSGVFSTGGATAAGLAAGGAPVVRASRTRIVATAPGTFSCSALSTTGRSLAVSRTSAR